jgi:3-hydroxy acid dehydrogenase/malonic semialdehyde reductase
MNQAARTALVTGASSGIGAALVRTLRQQGWQVIAVARRADRLAALAEETGAQALALDLRDTDALEHALRGLNVDAFIANAGVGRAFASIVDATREDIEATLSVNVTSVAHALRMIVPGMRARGAGHVVFVGSVAGLYPISSALYGASKGAIHMLAQNLRIELGGTGLRVTEVVPGQVATEFFEANFDDPVLRAKMGNPPIRLLDPEDVAASVAFALAQPRHVNLGRIEITPTEQAIGGASLTPLHGRG